jgi:DNA/RNA-binding domain of Phe-tRNA-synthetase-like protein
MTANELADAIEKGGKDGFFQDEIVAILRQQQAEIEVLKMRELTDKEIIEVWDEYYEDIDIITFARALLQKARE